MFQVQFAFCTLFVPAFPVAAAICLLNNILEIRVDAIKILASHRRPLPIRVSGIGIWNDFMGVIVKVAVLCNAGLLAFTSDAIVRLYYNFSTTDTYSFKGYPQFSMSWLPISSFWKFAGLEDELKEKNEEEFDQLKDAKCYYTGHRNTTAPYDITLDWWRVTCVRLGSFGLFVAIGFTFQFVYDACVPDVPKHVEVKIQRQKYVLAKAMESEQAYDNWLKVHSVVLKKDEKNDKSDTKSVARSNRSPSIVGKNVVGMFQQEKQNDRRGDSSTSKQRKLAWAH